MQRRLQSNPPTLGWAKAARLHGALDLQTCNATKTFRIEVLLLFQGVMVKLAILHIHEKSILLSLFLLKVLLLTHCLFPHATEDASAARALPEQIQCQRDKTTFLACSFVRPGSAVNSDTGEMAKQALATPLSRNREARES